MKHSTIAASAILVLFPILAIAHGGGVNSYGCHNQSSTSTHHCHSGDYNGMSFASQADFLAYIADQSNSSGDDTSRTILQTRRTHHPIVLKIRPTIATTTSPTGLTRMETV